MKRKTVESSQIKAVGYDENALILEIEFKSGSVYQYDRVPASVASCMMDAGAVESVGTYFGANVKDRFPTFRVDGGERVPVEKAKASAKSREFLLTLAKRAHIFDGIPGERMNASWFGVVKAAGRSGDWPIESTVQAWVESLLQVECSACIELLKDEA